MVVFKSLVILDLETSGLPSSGGKTKITELSLLGVLTDHVLESNRKCEGTPRVLQKLSLCFYPQKRIDFEASEITGLDNFLLEEIPTFNNEACEMVISFMQRMPSPLCVIAHNGMKFDFQLLKSELAAKDKVLPDEIYCADSILAFRTLFPYTPSMASTSAGLISPIRTISSSNPVTPPKHMQSVSNETVLDCSTWKKTDALIYEQQRLNETVLDCSTDLPSVLEQQRLNETTPKHSTRQACLPPLKRRNVLNDENSESQPKIVRKKLFKGQGKPTSYKLIDLYTHIHGREPEHGHRAENDTIALLECIVSMAKEFLPWIEGNNLLFSKIPPMW